MALPYRRARPPRGISVHRIPEGGVGKYKGEAGGWSVLCLIDERVRVVA
jgi:hypothetical protein